MNLVKLADSKKPSLIEVYVSEGEVADVIFHERTDLHELIAKIKDDWNEQTFDQATQGNSIWSLDNKCLWSYGGYLNGIYDE